jgi:hypothetical protein
MRRRGGADMTRVRRTAAATILLLLLAAACGGAAAGPRAAGADVYRMRVSVVLSDGSHRDAGTEWYQPSSGHYDVRGSMFGTSSRTVMLGDEVVRLSSAGESVTRGAPVFVRRAALPNLFETPGVVIFDARGGAGRGLPDGSRIHTTRSGGGMTISAALVIQEDAGTPPPPTRFVVSVDPPVTIAQARSDGAFRLPSGPPDTTVTELRPGSPSQVGLHPWWLGRAWDGRDARNVIEERSTRPAASDAPEHDIPAGGSYQVTYRLEGTPDDAGLEPKGVPGVPGIGNIPRGDVYVTTLRPGTPRLQAGGPSRHVTVAGRPATLLLPPPGITPELFWVETADALVEVRLWYELQPSSRRIDAVLRALRPVPGA